MKIFAVTCEEAMDEFVFESLLSKVGEQKKERLLKYLNKKDAYRGLLADLLVRKVLIEERKISNREIMFSTNEFGKPYCKNIADFHFNVSHSGIWVVGVADRSPVGIDIEKISPVDMTLAKSFYAKKEYNDLVMSKDPSDYFFSLWTLKESYIKYLGRGFAFSLRKFSIRINSGNDIRLEINDTIQKEISFTMLPIDAGYKMAICSNRPVIPADLNVLAFEDLLQTFV